MQQHKAIKQKYPDAILLFRVGDFYETFGQDAVVASAILGITLTKRNNGAASSAELAGFPHHSLDSYLHKLVKAGHRVAVCDQLEDPRQAKGIVKRGVTELVTPGIATNDRLLDAKSNNFLAAIHYQEQQSGIALVDISTGEFLTAEGSLDYIDKLLQTFKPAEVIFQRSFQKMFKEKLGADFYTYTLDSWVFDLEYASSTLLRHFQTHSLKGFGLEDMQAGIVAAGAVLHYLKETEHPNLGHITALQRIDINQYLWMDKFTVRNLELLGQAHTLLSTMDHTLTPMGARMLKRWLLMPLREPAPIRQRLDLVEHLVLETDLRQQLAEHLKVTGDIERLTSKIPSRKIGPRELAQLARSLEQIRLIKGACSQAADPYLAQLADLLDPCTALAGEINRQLADNPPALAIKGGMIREGVNQELDELRSISSGGRDFLASLQEKEATLTGISSLKISFNNVFGYYLEVTHAHKNKVPAHWIRKQTLTNAERYITPELKVYEEKITGAEERICTLELDLYDRLLQDLDPFILPLQANGQVLATIDCLSCFALNALRFSYIKPLVHEGYTLKLSGSRHPVIERHLPPSEPYISNDIQLDPAGQQIIILTGPNMSGKSALLRQTALITIMAHMGSFVPAAEASIPLTDKIFTRVGASDNVSGGESTFMVEMNETASIINNISPRSLVLLDEIGRGTSTYDGISIAWSIAEFLHEAPGAPKTLFATHYHELNELENQLPRIKNYHITHKELGNKIIFLRKLAPGGSTHSFGIHVAKMAGMPPGLIARANELLQKLEARRDAGQTAGGKKSAGLPELGRPAAPQIQLTIFDAQSQIFEDIRKKLEGIDIDRLTPVEALIKLSEIKALLKS